MAPRFVNLALKFLRKFIFWLLSDFMTECREEKEAERQRQEELFQRRLHEEVQRLTEKQRREIKQIKKKEWCCQCEKEAIYHCCWRTAYCTIACQHAHWPTHRPHCRRKKTTPAATVAGNGHQQQQQNNNNAAAAAAANEGATPFLID